MGEYFEVEFSGESCEGWWRKSVADSDFLWFYVHKSESLSVVGGNYDLRGIISESTSIRTPSVEVEGISKLIIKDYLCIGII